MLLQDIVERLDTVKAKRTTQPAREPTMQVLDPSGHLNVTWDAGNAEETRHAKEVFEQMTGEGYSAFRVGKGGDRGVRISAFDPDAEQMILLPQLRGG